MVILSGAAVSNWIPRNVFGDADALSIFSPAALDAHSFVIETTYTPSPDSAGVTAIVCNWYNGTANVAAPSTASQNIVYPIPCAEGFRIKDITGNVAATRTFKLMKVCKGL
jgi:hypothetical protein